MTNEERAALVERIAELEAVVDDLLIRFEPWSPHDRIAAERAREVLGKALGDN